jgi:malate/lactate dehydrogenase
MIWARPSFTPAPAGHADEVQRLSAILRDENAVLAVSSLAPKSIGLGDVFLSLPAIINRNGVARVLPIPLSAPERRAPKASASILKKHFASLDAVDAEVGPAEEYLQEAM